MPGGGLSSSSQQAGHFSQYESTKGPGREFFASNIRVQADGDPLGCLAHAPPPIIPTHPCFPLIRAVLGLIQCRKSGIPGALPLSAPWRQAAGATRASTQILPESDRCRAIRVPRAAVTIGVAIGWLRGGGAWGRGPGVVQRPPQPMGLRGRAARGGPRCHPHPDPAGRPAPPGAPSPWGASLAPLPAPWGLYASWGTRNSAPDPPSSMVLLQRAS